MKITFFILLLFSGIMVHSQINANAGMGIPCNYYNSAYIDFEDTDDNPPYTISLYIDNSSPYPDFFVDSTTVSSNDTLVTFLLYALSGDLIFIITDGNGDSSVFYANMLNPGLNGSIGDCSCMYGVIYAFAFGGIPPYNFQLQTNTGIIDSTSYTNVLFTGLTCQPNASLIITDAWGCSVYCTPPVDGGCGPGADPACLKEVYLTFQNTSAVGVCDGSIAWEIEGVDLTTEHQLIILHAGIPIDTLVLAPGVVSDTLFNLCTGYYQFKLDKDSTCFDFTSGSLNVQTPPLTTSFLSADSVTACIPCENTVAWSFQDYFINAPYQVLLVDNAGSVIDSDSFDWNNYSGNFGPLCPGDYEVIVINQQGDSLTAHTTVLDVPAVFQLNTVTVTPPNTGQSDGEIELFCNGGAAPYQYSIDNGITWQSSPLFSGLDTGYYSILITDAAGCNVSSSAYLTYGDVGLTEQQIPLQIFPNPTTGKINVYTSGIYSYQIQDMQGRILVKNQFTDNASIDLSNEPKGVYLLLLDSENGRSVQLILLQ